MVSCLPVRAAGCREREREDFALLFHLRHLVCVAFDWDVNHCAFLGPLPLRQQLENGPVDVHPSVFLSVPLGKLYPCSSRVHDLGDGGFLKTAWKGLAGSISAFRNVFLPSASLEVR